jgi:hypothetical protein
VLRPRDLVLVAAVACVAPAAAQEASVPVAHTYVVTGTLDGKPVKGEVTVRRDGARLLVEGTLGDREFRGLGEKSGPEAGGAWRVELPGSRGAAAVIATLGSARRPVPPRVLLLRRGPNDTLQATVADEAGAQVGTLAGAVRPPAECRPVRDTWWARHPVALWEIGRALWDLYKPGSRGLEELRGPVTTEHTKVLRAALEKGPKPYTTDSIYAAARALVRTPREALQLSFALVVDHPDLGPLKPLPGQPPGSTEVHDKYEHFFASAIMAHRSNGQGSFNVGLLKEVLDEVSGQAGYGGTGFSEDDLLADAQGAEFGQGLQCREPSR